MANIITVAKAEGLGGRLCEDAIAAEKGELEPLLYVGLPNLSSKLIMKRLARQLS
jgi:hypothetical protein